MITSSLTARLKNRAENCPQKHSIIILFGLSPNRIFFEIYRFWYLHLQTLADTALCEFAKANWKTVVIG